MKGHCPVDIRPLVISEAVSPLVGATKDCDR